MYCTSCVKSGKQNSFTAGCECFKTSSLSRHADTSDHKSSLVVKDLQANMKAAIKVPGSQQDQAITKAMKVVYWLATENIPLSKYESLVGLLTELGVPLLNCLKHNDKVDYQSYYFANEMLEAISNDIDAEIDEKLKESPCVTPLADESTDLANKTK